MDEPKVGNAYLITKERYYLDRIMTIVAITDYRVYWDLEHRESVNSVRFNGELIRYYDAIDIQYFNKFARRSGLELGEQAVPSWEV